MSETLPSGDSATLIVRLKWFAWGVKESIARGGALQLNSATTDLIIEAYERLSVLEQRLGEAQEKEGLGSASALVAEEYSPAFQDEYRRLWHEAAAERDRLVRENRDLEVRLGSSLAAYEELTYHVPGMHKEPLTSTTTAEPSPSPESLPRPVSTDREEEGPKP